MPKLLLILILTLFTIGLLSCKGKHGHANEYMNSVSFDKLVSKFESPDRAEWQKPDFVINKMEIKSNMVIGDIGAGTGYFTRRFARKVTEGEAVGLDVDERMLEYLQNDAKRLGLANYKFQKIDYDGTGIEKHRYDILFLCNVYHHVEKRTEYFERLKPNLKENGRMVIVDFKKQESSVGPPLKHRLAKSLVLSEMKSAGFTLSEDISGLAEQYFLIFTKP